MFATFITIALFAAASVQNVAGYALLTPELTQCKEATISWQDAVGSVNIIAVPAADVCNGNMLADLGEHDGNTATWKVALPAGTKVVLTSIDSRDEEAWTAEITVKDSDDDSCVDAALKTSSPAAFAQSSSSASSSAAGTLVVSPTYGASSSSSTGSSGSTTNKNGPVGGVASDPITAKSNGAIRQSTTPMLVLTAIAAVLAASL